MRWIRPATLVACAAFCVAADAPKGADDAAKLKGLWAMTSVTVRGVRQPDDPTAGALITIFDGASYLQKRGSEILEEGTYEVVPGSSPRAIDFVVKSGPDSGTRRLGIYEQEGNTLKLAVARPGVSKRPKDFGSGRSSDVSVIISRRYRP